MARTPYNGQPFVFTADDDWDFPDLGRRVVPPGARVDVAAEDHRWTEFDTALDDLASAGASLTATGGTWELRIDGAAAQTVEGGAAGARTMPRELRDAALGLRAGRPLVRRREVREKRVTRVVVDADDALLGEVEDVWQRESTGARTRRVQVIAVDDAFGSAVVRRLRASGARPVRMPVTAPAPPPPRTVGDAVRGFLAAQRRVILDGDVTLRRGDDAIHATRVAVRRVRSVLRVVTVFDPDAAAAFDAQLAWLSGVLGAVRDGDVLREHFERTLAELPDAPWRAAASDAVARALDDHQRRARAVLATTMAGRRYLTVLRELRTWAEDPPLLDAARQPVKRLARYVRDADRTLAKRLTQAVDPESTHRARKSAKRARYVSEFVVATIGGEAQAGDAGRQAKKLQATLGDRQDAAMAADFLAALLTPAAGAELAPAAAFGCGVAWAAEVRRAAG